MYFDNSDWKLSLIDPASWEKCPYFFFATCTMNEDRSWNIAPIKHWEKNICLYERIDEMKQEFFQSMNSDSPVIESLPYFAIQLPYYQRLAANALANSLKKSLELSVGITESKQTCGKKLMGKANQISNPALELFISN